MAAQTHVGTILRGKDIFLCHTGADKPWVENLAELIERVPYQDRHLGVVFDKWDFDKGKNIVLEIDKHIDECRFIGVVVSETMLAAEWPTMERTIAVWSDPSGRQGRVLPLLLENVDMPASLRIRNWIDFRNPTRFEESFLELVGCLKNEAPRRGRGGLLPIIAPTSYAAAPVVITASNAADAVTEQLVSNLLPVSELPTVVQTASTSMRKKEEIRKFTENQTAPFILREGALFTFSDLHDSDNPLQAAIDLNTLHDEPFAPWFADDDQRRWAVELLNLCLKQHCRERFLIFDKKGQRFFFRPYLKDGNGEKTIKWCIGGKNYPRRVTSRHYAYLKNAKGEMAKQEFGWRHQALRAVFIYLPNGLFLKLNPTYMLTKEDGKTARGGSRVGPILSQWLNQERNGQILRSLRFWSLVLTRGNKHQLRIATGNEAIVINVTPTIGSIGFGINGDSIDYDRLMNAEFHDDLAIPDLEAIHGGQMLFDFEDNLTV